MSQHLNHPLFVPTSTQATAQYTLGCNKYAFHFSDEVEGASLQAPHAEGIAKSLCMVTFPCMRRELVSNVCNI